MGFTGSLDHYYEPAPTEDSKSLLNDNQYSEDQYYEIYSNRNMAALRKLVMIFCVICFSLYCAFTVISWLSAGKTTAPFVQPKVPGNLEDESLMPVNIDSNEKKANSLGFALRQQFHPPSGKLIENSTGKMKSQDLQSERQESKLISEQLESNEMPEAKPIKNHWKRFKGKPHRFAHENEDANSAEKKINHEKLKKIAKKLTKFETDQEDYEPIAYDYAYGTLDISPKKSQVSHSKSLHNTALMNSILDDLEHSMIKTLIKRLEIPDHGAKKHNDKSHHKTTVKYNGFPNTQTFIALHVIPNQPAVFQNVTNTSLPFTVANFSVLEEKIQRQFTSRKKLMIRSTNIFHQLLVSFHSRNKHTSFPYEKPWFTNDEIVYPKFLTCTAKYTTINASMIFYNGKVRLLYRSQHYEKSHVILCVAQGRITIMLHDEGEVDIDVTSGECIYMPQFSKYYFKNGQFGQNVFLIKYWFNYVSSMLNVEKCSCEQDWAPVQSEDLEDSSTGMSSSTARSTTSRIPQYKSTTHGTKFHD